MTRAPRAYFWHIQTGSGGMSTPRIRQARRIPCERVNCYVPGCHFGAGRIKFSWRSSHG